MRNSMSVLLLTSVCALAIGRTLSGASTDADSKKSPKLTTQVKQMLSDGKHLEDKKQFCDAEDTYLSAKEKQDAPQVAQALSRISGQCTDPIRLAARKSRKQFSAGDFGGAAETLKGLLNDNPDLTPARFNLALCYYKMNDRGSAINELDQLVAKMPEGGDRERYDRIRATFVTGEVLANLTPEVEASVTRINQLYRTIDAPAPSVKGIQTLAAEEKAVASRNQQTQTTLCGELTRLQALLPKSPAVLYNRARCAEDAGDSAAALKLFNQYLDIAPNVMDGSEVKLKVEELASLAGMSGQTGDAIRQHYSAATSYLKRRQYVQVQKEYEEVERLAPDHADAKLKLGTLHEGLGNYQAAYRYYSSYARLSGRDVTVWTQQLNRSSSKAREQKSAVSDLFSNGWNPDETHFATLSGKLEIAKTVAPLDPFITTELAFSLQRAGQSERAIPLYDELFAQGMPVTFNGTMPKPKKAQNSLAFSISGNEVWVRLYPDRIEFLGQYTNSGPAFAESDSYLPHFWFDMVHDPSRFGSVQVIKIKDIKSVSIQNHRHLELSLSNGKKVLFAPYIPDVDGDLEPNVYFYTLHHHVNQYAKLFRRYLDLSQVQLAKEGASGADKFFAGMAIASAGLGAYSASRAAGGTGAAAQTAAITSAVMVSMNVMQQFTFQYRFNALQQARFRSMPAPESSLQFIERLQ